MPVTPPDKSANLNASSTPVAFTVVDKSQYPIFAILDKVWSMYPALRSDCSGYLKKVAQQPDLCIFLPDFQANGLVDWLAKQPGWLNLGNDAAKAASLAAQGYFVVAGKTEKTNGHVAIVVPGWSSSGSPGGSPMGYWGSLTGTGFANKSLSFAWMADNFWNSKTGERNFPHKIGAPSPLDQVLYFALYLPFLKKSVLK
jgi:hypothetical protein